MALLALQVRVTLLFVVTGCSTVDEAVKLAIVGAAAELTVTVTCLVAEDALLLAVSV